MPVTVYEFDSGLRQRGFVPLCGVDEAGRGPLAGPVFAAAVILPEDFSSPWLNDSKKVTPRRREILFEEITASARYAIASASEEEIDRLNILQATYLAMERAWFQLKEEGEAPVLTLVDGNRLPPRLEGARTLVGGDGISASIAAASILAKVTRDRYMLELAEKYPQYAFEKHKGYGTKLHYEKLAEFGPSPVHRMSFLKKWKEQQG